MSPARDGTPRGVDRPYATAQQYERWFIRDCARCGRRGYFAARWPDGHVCRTCHDRALARRGACPGCDQQRALPGRDPDTGAAVCTRCAGFTYSYACTRCQSEGKLHRGRLCTRCTLGDALDVLLDDGTGHVAPRLVPLREALAAMDNPLTGLTWLYKPYATRLLRGLATGEIELTHEVFHHLQPWRAAAHLRELLMGCGLLPKIDKHLALFERWLVAEHLPRLEEPVERLIREFTTWHVLPQLRRRAARRALTPSSRGIAGGCVKRATEFLAWLAARGRTMPGCTQADLDHWHTEHRDHEHQALRPFLLWAMDTGRMPRLHTTARPTTRRAPITQHRRLALLRRLLADDTIDLRARVAGSLTLLYAQPLSRIVQMTTDDIITSPGSDGDGRDGSGGEVLLRLGDPPAPVPTPFAELLLELVAARTNMRTATNPGSRWLFPGRRAGQPLRPEYLGQLIRDAGLPTVAARTAALHQLVLQAPAPVVADMLGFHYTHTARVHAHAGGTWNRYAPGPRS